MSATVPCSPCCSTTTTTEVPGTPGASAYTTTTASFVVPAANANVVVSVGSTAWMVNGQNVVITGPYNFQVVSINSGVSVTLKWLDYELDGATGATVASGSGVSASGPQPSITDPLPIANGGTGQITAAAALSALLGGSPLPIASGGTAGATKAAAQTALGLGVDGTLDTGAALAYDITASAAQITGMEVTVPATGLYLILACMTVDYQGVTFAASRTLTFKVRNTTAGADLITRVRVTDTPTTARYPSIDYTLFGTQSLTINHNLQLWVDLSVVETAGASVVNNAQLIIVPLRLT